MPTLFCKKLENGVRAIMIHLCVLLGPLFGGGDRRDRFVASGQQLFTSCRLENLLETLHVYLHHYRVFQFSERFLFTHGLLTTSSHPCVPLTSTCDKQNSLIHWLAKELRYTYVTKTAFSARCSGIQ